MNDDDVRTLVGRRIKELRRNLGVSQFALGEKVDINQRQIALIEGGKSFPSLATLNKLSQTFNCEIKDFFEFQHLKDDLALKTEMCKMLEDFTSEQIQLCYQIMKSINEKFRPSI